MSVTMLKYHIDRLEKSLVKFGNHPLYDAIDLRTLTVNLSSFENIHDWIKNKNMPEHLKKNVIKAILSTNPPEEVKFELMLHLL